MSNNSPVQDDIQLLLSAVSIVDDDSDVFSSFSSDTSVFSTNDNLFASDEKSDNDLQKDNGECLQRGSLRVRASDTEIGIKRRSPVATMSSQTKRRKSVTFADSQGGILVQVREFDKSVDPLEYLGCSETQLWSRKNASDQSTCRSSRKYILLFEQPCVKFASFLKKLATQKVVLENAQIIADKLIGTIKVCNLDYFKIVDVRVTMDGWKTCKDVRACFLHSESAEIDVFTFSVNIAELTRYLKFCIRYQCKNQEFWDNNDSKNYCVSVSLTNENSSFI